ncbi:aldo/keto reductase [Candidatus Synechococcus calcipolaris G9]|uniref:Aldo/keto reductase n=1 Tax=Candidatus Synechococcus calcipolaris G9 TaxID=1497997 RepID=A0ABT6ETU1_9SYNE|nr:aldo/keto reductase [Candidatus Synechococcus calcipolaris]MDG2989334.1 aldo/keto reductase [Candidatus Synechococcus calcipolaris G9]
MRYRRFGRTNLNLSVFSLGTMRYLGSAMEAEGVVQRAIALGVNHLETAPAYGPSEAYLGQSLKNLPVSDPLYITTKVLPKGTCEDIMQQVDQSLGRLGRDHLECLALHGLNQPEHLGWLDQGGQGALEAVLASGKVAHIGFSSHGPLEVILAAMENPLFSFVNLHYTYFFQRNAPAIARAREKDLGIFIISPADKGGRLYRPPEKLDQLCQPLSPLHWAYRWLLSQPAIATLSFGPATVAEVDFPLGIADEDGPLTAIEKEILDRLDRVFQALPQGDRCEQCYACLPCPEDIHIPEVLRLRNLTLAYDMQEFGEYRYRMFGQAGHWFPGQPAHTCTECGDCLPRCPSNLEIPRLLQDAHDRLRGPQRRRLWETI